MTLDKIQKITKRREDVFIKILFGYLRVLSERELKTLLKKHYKEDALGPTIFRCFVEGNPQKEANDVASFFLKEFIEAKDERILKRIGSHLNQLFDHCSFHLQKQIARAFLSFNKKYLRNYAYKKNLEKLEMVEIAVRTLEKHPVDNELFARCAIFNFSEKYVEENFRWVLELSQNTPYLVRQLFIKKSKIGESDWNWLYRYDPIAYVYVSLKKNRKISDRILNQIYHEHYKVIQKEKEPPFKAPLQEDRTGLLLWCFAGMKKWKLIENIVKKGMVLIS